MSDVDARLKGALNGTAENTKGGILTSSGFKQFAGYKAVSGVIATDQLDNGRSDITRETVFLKGNNMFLILSNGVGSDDYNRFANSFQFTR